MKNRTTVLRAASILAFMMASNFLGTPFPAYAQMNGPTAAKKHKWSYAALNKVPEKARARMNPLENDPDAQAAGGKLFEQHCAECHGRKAEGGRRGPSLRAREVQEATSGEIFWVLTNGIVRHGMPDWSKLPEPERWQIVRFIQCFRVSGALQAPPAQR
ncbi:MAG TPA: c-type cytochrome [Candidatus Acidoferrum sp.]|nr:c-type cytochrome [Candidatus Acidoferrum sp.]